MPFGNRRSRDLDRATVGQAIDELDILARWRSSRCFEPFLGIRQRLLVNLHIDAVLQEARERHALVDEKLLFRIKIEKLAIESLDQAVGADHEKSAGHVFDRRLEHFVAGDFSCFASALGDVLQGGPILDTGCLSTWSA